MALFASGASDSEVNSTEISTDSEFDDEQPHRVPPAFHIEFKPLVEVDPTIKLVQAGRAPLAVPRPGDYELSKTASTEGIASKKSLELKKKYLLGEGTGGLGILKSGSASALDSKFKSFHSNITECQKLLNPAAQGSLTMHTFLKNSPVGVSSAGQVRDDVTKQVPQQQERDTTSLEVHNDTEKENVYVGKMSAIGSMGSAGGGGAKRLSLVETINATLVENKLNEIKSNVAFQPSTKDQDASLQQSPDLQAASLQPRSKTKQQNGLTDLDSNGHTVRPTSINNNNNNNTIEIMEIIDLVSPDREKAGDGKPAPLHHDARARCEKGTELKYIANLKHAYIDLTNDSPNCDRSLVETTLDFSIAQANVNSEGSVGQSTNEPGIISSIRIDNNENKIDPLVANGMNKSSILAKKEPTASQQRQQPHGEEGCHETTLQVPTVPWATKEEEEEEEEGIESDSISESRSNSSGSSSSSNSNSTSSVEDIPHFILDSTTSPETQNDERFVPRLEVRDATGELMQIDSLMIIDGRYIGDPEDLKLMEQLPPDTQIAAKMLQDEINQDSINTIVDGTSVRIDDTAQTHQIAQKESEKSDELNDRPKDLCEEQEDDEEPVKTPTPPDAERISPLSDFVTKRKARFKFDTKNENKIDTLRNLPFVLDADRSVVGAPSLQKPKYLNLTQHKPSDVDTDTERTPMASEPATHGKSLTSPVALHLGQSPLVSAPDGDGDSDSQDDTEITTQNNLTETELSDWAADDAVSENFVDIEFALNSNKGTIRRNHKSKQTRLQQQKRLGNGSGSATRTVPASVVKKSNIVGCSTSAGDGIIRNLALEDIEFMDTGSEDESCIETYSTTNRMMLRNRGYVEIMDPRTESKRALYPPHVYAANGSMPLVVVEAINKQIAGRVDYIEQGSYLLASDDIKTPMNEEPLAKTTFSALATAQSAGKLRTTGNDNDGDEDCIPAGPTIATTDNFPKDIEEDSLVVGTTSQEADSMTMTGSTTVTEESEALTVLGAVAGSSTSSEASPIPRGRGAVCSSSGRGSVASFNPSLNTSRQEIDAPFPQCEKSATPMRKISSESSSGKRSSLERKDVRKDSIKWVEDVGYEEYVKRLQLKIQQISNARDSLEVKKSKRKSSKGELVPEKEEVVCVEDLTSTLPPPIHDKASGSNGTMQTDYKSVDAVELPKSVEKKIEEIAKERVKQKDIIHDLVMDKLQTKKQLNAEKRMNRSRNRNNALLVGNGSPSSGVSLSALSKANEPPSGGEGATGGAGHRIVAPEDRYSSPGAATERPERSPLVVSNTPQQNVHAGSISMIRSPASVPQKQTVERSVASKDASVSHFNNPQQQYLVTPRPRSTADSESLIGGPLTTDKLREEARSRARLKSNQDLGLSPEDRLLLIRKKYLINSRGLTDEDDDANLNQSDDAKCKEQHRSKLISSKSVNDVSMLKQQNHHLPSGSLLLSGALMAPIALETAVQATDAYPHPLKKLTDCVSDPNLCVHSNTANEPVVGGGDEVRLRVRNKRKDRERRKSIIEKVSEFFNGRKKVAENGGSSSKDASPTKHRTPNLLNVNSSFEPVATATGSSSGGGFLRFKISPKLKDKSKTKESSPYGRCASEDCLNSSLANGSPTMSSNDVPPTTLTYHNSYTPIGRKEAEELEPPPIPPLPLNYQRSDDETAASNEPNNELKKMRAMSKTSRQAELKRLRIAQEIQREQEQIEVQINDLEARGVEIEKELRGESGTLKKNNVANLGANDEVLVKEWLEIMGSITRLKVRDDELNIRQQELQLEHRHAQLKEELNMRLSFGKLDKNSSDVAAEGAILNEMLEIVAEREGLRALIEEALASAPDAVPTADTSASSSIIVSSARVSKDTDI